MNKVLICLGMHRSGTSLIANWLHQCGLNMGDRLYESDIHNKKGYFEDEDFLELHEEVFKKYQIAPGGLMPPVNIQLDNYYLKKFEYLVKLKNNLRDQWGWKEPRTCLFTNIYHQLLPDARYLIIFRDYPHVVDSLIRRRRTDLDNWYYKELGRYGKLRYYGLYQQRKEELKPLVNIYLDAWCMFNQRLLELTSYLPQSAYFFADYQELKAGELHLFNTLTNAWGFNLNFCPFSSVFDAALINEKMPELTFNSHLVNKAETIKNEMLKLRIPLTNI